MGDSNDRGKGEHGPQHVTVHVLHINETERVNFQQPPSATLQQVWDQAYIELKVDRKPTDIFQTGGSHPVSLMSHLGLTLEQAKERDVIKNYQFGIVSETGGA